MSTSNDIHTAKPSLEGRRVLISGGTTGIGRAIVRLLASEGAHVFTFGRHEPQLKETLEAVREAGGRADGITADASKSDDLARVFSEASAALGGGIDVFIANAALAADGALDMKEGDWRYVVETNLCGYIGGAREAALRMKAQGNGGGHIVLVGSMSADVRESGGSVYVATKSGIQGFAEALRKEVNEHGIRVSLIEPGSVGSDMQPTTPEEEREKIQKGEMLRAEDIAVCVHYILSQPARCDVVEVKLRPHLQSI